MIRENIEYKIILSGRNKYLYRLQDVGYDTNRYYTKSFFETFMCDSIDYWFDVYE